MGVLGKFVGMIRILLGSVGMPAPRLVLSLFIMFGSGPMRLRGVFVHLGSFPMKFVLGFSVL